MRNERLKFLAEPKSGLEYFLLFLTILGAFTLFESVFGFIIPDYFLGEDSFNELLMAVLVTICRWIWMKVVQENRRREEQKKGHGEEGGI